MNASIERRDAPERALERDADELEHRLDHLGGDIDDARQQLKARREDADLDEDAADDEDDGEDPAAFDDPEVAEEDEDEEE